MSKKVSVTLTTSFRSFVRGRHDSLGRRDDHVIEDLVVRQLTVCRKSLSPVEVSLPASILAQEGVAAWVRKHRLCVDVCSMHELYLAMASGVHPNLLTVHTDAMDATEVERVATLGAGRVVLGSLPHIEVFGRAAADRVLNVLLGVRDSHSLDSAVERVLEYRRLNLIGLYCDVGSSERDFVSYPAAVCDVIAQMEHIRRQHGLQLTCLGIGGAGFFGTDDERVLYRLATQVDESVDDACATLRFPRPVVVIAGGPDMIGWAAA